MKKIVSRCGFICSQCLAYKDNIKNDADRQKVSDFWFKYYDFRIDPADIDCDGCLAADDKNPRLLNKDCEIRHCVQQKGFDNCSSCSVFICERLEKQMSGFEQIAEKYRNVITADEYESLFAPYNARKNFKDLK